MARRPVGARVPHRAVQGLPDDLGRTLTSDQGREMAMWVDLEVAADVEFYLCNPRSPWQRPSSEHMSALVRQYLSGRTDLSLVSRRGRDERAGSESPQLAHPRRGLQ